MNPRSIRLVLVLSVVLGGADGPSSAAADGVDTILRRTDDAVETPVVLGPTRQQGDFGEHLDALLAAAEPAAEATAPTIVPAAPAAPGERQPPLILPILGGIAGGAIGLYGGGFLGFVIDEDDGGEWDGILGAVVGGLIGEIVLLPLGVHIGNARLGSYAADLGISALTGAAGLGVLSLAHGSTAGAITVVGVQLATVVYTERRRARMRIEARRAAGAP